MEIITARIRQLSSSLYRSAEADYHHKQLLDRYGINIQMSPEVHEGQWILRQVCNILRPIPAELVKACGIRQMLIQFLGPNMPYYPNHGYFTGDLVALNSDIFIHPDAPDDFMDNHGYTLSRSEETLYHEFGHGFDAYHGDLSLQPAWTTLSGWSDVPQPGLQQLRIKEQDAPEVIGEWFYDPKAEFTRFYAKRNPWDDFADSFSFYVAGLKNKVPATKKNYFDKLLKKYQ
jgi:hypothetical protein